MPTLVSIRLGIPGEWADAWLYKGHVLLWDRSGFMYYIALSEVRSYVNACAGEDIAALSDLLIFRNDWKLREPFPLLMGLSEVAAKIFHRMGTSQLSLPLANLEIGNISSEPAYSDFLLDTAIYADRVFAATDSGIYETAVRLDRRVKYDAVEQITDVWARSIGAHGARVVASLGEEGLVTRSIVVSSDWWSKDKKAPLHRIDDYSLSSSFARFNVLNYRGDAAPSFLRARTEADYSMGRTTTVVRSYDAGIGLESELRHVLSTTATAPGYSDNEAEGVRVVGDSKSRLLVAGPFGHAVVNLAEPRKRTPLRLTPASGFQGHSASSYLFAAPNATHAVESGFVIEDLNRTGLITAAGAYDLINESSARVRSFPQSKRHTDCLTATFDDRVELVGFVEVP